MKAAWFDGGYMRIRLVRPVANGVVVQFDNGDTVGVSLAELTQERHFENLRPEDVYLSEEGTVIIPGNPSFEIPWMTFRMLTDEAFAQHMKEQDVFQRRIVGERVRRLRQKKNLTLEQAAALADLNPAWLSRLECGEDNLADNLGGLKQILTSMGYQLADITKEP